VAKDVADLLGYSDTQAMTRRLRPGTTKSYTDTTSGQARNITVLTEPDKVVQNNMTGWSGEVLTPRFTAKGVMVVGNNLPKFGFKRETQTIEFMDLELPEE
jgi:hypothetical protein